MRITLPEAQWRERRPGSTVPQGNWGTVNLAARNRDFPACSPPKDEQALKEDQRGQLGEGREDVAECESWCVPRDRPFWHWFAWQSSFWQEKKGGQLCAPGPRDLEGQEDNVVLETGHWPPPQTWVGALGEQLQDCA